MAKRKRVDEQQPSQGSPAAIQWTATAWDSQDVKDEEGWNSQDVQDEEGWNSQDVQDEEGWNSQDVQDEEGWHSQDVKDEEGWNSQDVQDEEGWNSQDVQHEEGWNSQDIQDEEGWNSQDVQDEKEGCISHVQDEEGGWNSHVRDEEGGWNSQDVRDEQEGWNSHVQDEEGDDTWDGQATFVSRGGFSDLSEEEQEKLLRMPEGLKREIGFKNVHPEETGENPKALMQSFFSRYTQSTIQDYYFEGSQRRDRNGSVWFTATLVTPSLYDKRFLGEMAPSLALAESSACLAFFKDSTVLEVASKMPPTIRNVRRHVCKMLKPGWQREMERRGIDWKVVREEVIRRLFDQFQSMGCRTALWDNNV